MSKRLYAAHSFYSFCTEETREDIWFFDNNLNNDRGPRGSSGGCSLARFTNGKNRGSRITDISFVFSNHENKQIRYSFNELFLH